ncbi:MAG: cell division protein FtsZ, partial [Candidatus Micrarchaeota archaeon]|nr:cell division protein FtsZ [Candidatus Micrarchaeota archaeon]
MGGIGGKALGKFRKLPKGCSLLAVDTDKKDLAKLSGRIGKLLIGKKTLGGRKPEKASEVGLAVKEDLGEIRKRLRGASLVFVLAASGGLTGMAGAPRIVVTAKDLGAEAVWA